MELTLTSPRSLEDLERQIQAGSDQLAFIPYAEALRAHGRLGVALKICQQGLSRVPNSVAGRVLLARIHYDMGKYEAAERECEAVLAKAPESVSVRKLLAMISIKHREFIKALGLLEELSTIVQDDAEVVTALFEVQRGLAEKFAQELSMSGAFTERESRADTRDQLFQQIADRNEVKRCEIVAGNDEESAVGGMLRSWQAAARGETNRRVRMAIVETTEQTMIVRALRPHEGSLVVTLRAGASIGAVKHLVEKFVALPADEKPVLSASNGASAE